MARCGYVALFFMSVVTAGLLRTFGQNVLSRLPVFDDCGGSLFPGNCVGNQLVYRISFSLSCFFIYTTLLSCAGARGFENTCCQLLFQLPLYICALVASFFIPNGFYNGYVDIARVSSGLYIILQIIIILDSTYSLRDYLLDKMDDADRNDEARDALLGSSAENLPQEGDTIMWKGAYLGIVSLCMALSAVGLVLMFLHYADKELNVVFISITLLSVILLTALSVQAWVNVGLLPSAAVSLYLVLLCHQTVQANDSASRALLHAFVARENPMGVFLNSFVAAFTITWTSWRTSATNTTFFGPIATPRKCDGASDEIDDELASIGRPLVRLATKDKEVVPEYQFHVLMALASLYMAMVLTRWGSVDGSSSNENEIVTMWVKAISQWVASGLFLWTLLAPALFPNREFL